MSGEALLAVVAGIWLSVVGREIAAAIERFLSRKLDAAKQDQRLEIASPVLDAVEQVRFDKRMVGTGFEHRRLFKAECDGKETVFILVTTERPK